MAHARIPRQLSLLVASCLVAGIVAAAAEAAVEATAEMVPEVADVLAAFDAIAQDGTGTDLRLKIGSNFPEGYNKGHMPYSEHFQGIIRGQGTDVLYLSGSGLTEHVGQLFVASGLNGIDRRAEVVEVRPVDETYDHCGGLSAYGRYLVVGCESGCSFMERVMGKCADHSVVHFYDIHEPTAPTKMLFTVARPSATAGASSLVQESSGKYLLLVGRTDSAILDFYRSTATSLEAIAEEDDAFELVGTWRKDMLTAADGVSPYFGDYQNLKLVRQVGGQLFMFGTYRTFKGLGQDYLDVFKVTVSEGGAISIEQLGSKRLNCRACFFLPWQVIVIGLFMSVCLAAVCLSVRSSWVACHQQTDAFASFEDEDEDEDSSSDDEQLDCFTVASACCSRNSQVGIMPSLRQFKDDLTTPAAGRKKCLRHFCCKLLLPMYGLLAVAAILGVAAWFVVRGVNFSAGAGVYVKSPEELVVYATDWEPSGGAIAVKEFS